MISSMHDDEIVSIPLICSGLGLGRRVLFDGLSSWIISDVHWSGEFSGHVGWLPRNGCAFMDPFERNLPVLLGLLSSCTVISSQRRLLRSCHMTSTSLIPSLRQLATEINGKHVTLIGQMPGRPLEFISSQLHQYSSPVVTPGRFIPCDFIAFAQP
jgi:hypothetical protein